VLVRRSRELTYTAPVRAGRRRSAVDSPSVVRTRVCVCVCVCTCARARARVRMRARACVHGVRAWRACVHGVKRALAVDHILAVD
jgi:hypothetical protein